MMRLPEFRYLTPKTISEAAEILSENMNSTRLVAGGTDLWPNMKRRHQSARTVVSLGRIAGLRGTSGGPEGGMRIGAMTTLSEILRNRELVAAYPGLARAVASISSPVLRNMGTIGGNLCLDTRCTYYNQSEEWREAIGYCMKEVGQTCWVATSSPRCWAISASDSAPLLCALGAEVSLLSVRGTREIKVTELFRDDGIEYLSKARDEILTEVRVPGVRNQKSTYWKLRRRGSIDFPVLGAAVATSVRKGVIESASIYLSAVASSPLECRSAAQSLVGKTVSVDVIAEAADLAQKVATPMDNTDFTLQWRRQMVEAYVRGALSEVLGVPSGLRTPEAWSNALVV